MQIYQKHILKSIASSMITITLIITCFVWITQVLRIIYLVDRGIEFKLFFELTILFIPSILFTTLPVISVVSMLHGYSNLQDQRQLLILSSSGGLSNYELIKPALMIAFITTVIAFYLSAYLVPISYSILKQKLNDFKEGYVSNIVEPREFNQISKHSTVYVDKKNPDGSLYGIILFNNKTHGKKVIYFAKYGKILKLTDHAIKLELNYGFCQGFDYLGNLTKLYFDSMSVTLITDVPGISYRNKTSNELYINEMIWPDKSLSVKKKQRLTVDGHLRIIWPIFNFAFVFLSLGAFLRCTSSQKSKKFIFSVLPVLVFAYCHFLLQKISYEETNYIVLSYVNLFVLMIAGIFQSIRV